MKDKTLQIVKAVLTAQMNYWAFFTLAVTLLGIARGGSPELWRWGLLCLMPLFFLYFRLRMKFVLCLAGHLLTAALFGLLVYDESANGFLCLLMVLGFFGYSMVLRADPGGVMGAPLNPVVAVGLAAAGLFLMTIQEREGLTVYYLVPVLLYLGLYFIYCYLENFSSFLAVNDSGAGRIPQKDIFRCGILLASAFSLGSVGIMLLFSGSSILSDLLKLLQKGLIWFLRRLFSGGTEPDDAAVTEEVSGSGTLYGLEAGEAGLLWQVLEKIALVILVTGLITLAVYGLYRLAKLLYERFSVVALPEEQGVLSRTDLREKCSIEKREQSGRGRVRVFGLLNAQERIRRIYKKTVWNGRNMLVREGDTAECLNTMTARECGQRLSRAELAEIYEKARYSGETCTAEDVRKARAAVKKS